MGLWDYVYRNAPDLTFIKDVVSKVNQSLEDDEVRDGIRRSGAIAAKYAAREALKTLPGGSLMYDMGSEWLCYKSSKVENPSQAKKSDV